MPQQFTQPTVTLEMVKKHGLNPEEYERIKEILGREPNYTELGIFSVMWSEHCSYKNSIALLKTLPREGSSILAEAGEENAGAVDIGEGLAVVFKIESHNHPSAIEPYQGAATGVGGILRDIFTMGARPIAALNSLRFGSPSDPHVRYLVDGVVRGIGDYGNSFGVPTVAGEVYFDDAYTTNPLINAMAVGIMKTDGICSAVAKGEGNAIMIVGSKTGRDGIHGATFASEELTEASQEKRPAVQIGDPFTEKLLLEATLEIIDKDLVVGIQDMGAAGLTCSSAEMSAKGESGIEIHIDLVPVRESAMTPYEILLSESQERMLVCVKKGKEDDVRAVFDKWDLDSTIIGQVTSDGLMTVKLNGEVVSQIPSEVLVLGGSAPIYHRESKRPAYMDKLNHIDLTDYSTDCDWNDTLLRMLAAPNICHKGWVFEQYDSMVRTNTSVGPGSDAAVMRLRKTNRALAMATDCNGRYCYLNPRLGARSAVAECARNIVCSGGKPLAITNCLNFGNPYKPGIYYGFSEAVAGMGEACRVFDTPVTGGNVSFYNEDPERAVFPTPTIGMIGLVENIDHITTQWFKNDGDTVMLLGDTREELGASEYIHAIHGQNRGPVPKLDLLFELKLQQTLLAAIESGLIKSAHDVSDGGLAIALAESCIGNSEHSIGAAINLGSDLRPDCLLFGESQSRVVISCAPDDIAEIITLFRKAGIPAKEIGTVGGHTLTIDKLVDMPLDKLHDAFYDSLPRIMEEIG
ncbi:MAG: phosphoribosylformylglycinamidine synthase subunit PurL [Candidatus Zixiibacteriota bacterium]|nr:MAG: phosphoribosylformylglycinamidine synthase subunit PurL [candidate division Zixibacteria bacterium]